MTARLAIGFVMLAILPVKQATAAVLGEVCYLAAGSTGCPGNSECILTSSSCQTLSCQCAEGFVENEGRTTCKKMVKIDEYCNYDHTVCPDEARCINGRCVCSGGHDYNNATGECGHGSVPIGGDCSVHICYNEMECTQSETEPMAAPTCQCPPDRKKMDDYHCIEKMVGDNCLADSDCVHAAGASCTGGICSCSANAPPPVEVMLANDITGRYQPVWLCIGQAATLGESCQPGMTYCQAPYICIECGGGTWSCGVQQVQTTTTPSTTTTMLLPPPRGINKQSTKSPGTLAKVDQDGVKIVSKQLVVETSFVVDVPRNNELFCIKSEDCGRNAYCDIESPNCNGAICKCTPGFRRRSDGRCARVPSIGGQCDESIDLCPANAECFLNVCQCLKGHSVTNNGTQCVAGGPNGFACMRDDECRNELVCDQSAGRCVCPLGFMRRGNDHCIPRLYGDACESDDDCMYDGGFCDGGNCGCPSGYRPTRMHVRPPYRRWDLAQKLPEAYMERSACTVKLHEEGQVCFGDSLRLDFKGTRLMPMCRLPLYCLDCSGNGTYWICGRLQHNVMPFSKRLLNGQSRDLHSSAVAYHSSSFYLHIKILSILSIVASNVPI